MKRSFVLKIIYIFLFSLTVLGADTRMKITGGNVQYGLKLGPAYSSIFYYMAYVNSDLYFYPLKYFAVGVSGHYYSRGEETNYGFGPSIKYYYSRQQRLANYVSQDVVFMNQTDAAKSTVYITRFGLDIFLNETFSLGPSISYNFYNYDDSEKTDSGYITFLAGLGVFF
jgi:hypothetical protein